ncbi:hypothetical protein F6Y05_39260 [Bacillus megaterium]|nr:hypothetical protein [Priestia megaterium]
MKYAKLYGKNLFIEEVTSINAPQLEAKIKFYQKQFGVELVFVDYIQIMKTRNNNTPKEVSDFSEISYDLRELAKATQVALVLGAQLSRDVEKRDDKRPLDSDLKNSGSFEQDAFAIIHLYRDVVYNKDTEEKRILEVIIGKNRFGEGNITIKLPYDYSVQSIYQKSIQTDTALLKRYYTYYTYFNFLNSNNNCYLITHLHMRFLTLKYPKRLRAGNMHVVF